MNIPFLKNTDSGNFLLIAGPCVIESESITMKVGEVLSHLCDELDIPLIFKASYKKANRSRPDSYTGPGDKAGLKMLRKVGDRYHLPVITDIHSEEEAFMAADYVDVLQIPAFLCRQTELLRAAGKTGKPVNIKKGQFLSGSSMKYAVEKVYATGNKQVMLTERGTTFGYQDLVVDFRNIPLMKENQVPVIMDVTHSLQQPNQPGGVSGGQPEMINTMAKTAIAAGADGLFVETHPNPEKAKSDGANMMPLTQMENMLKQLIPLYKLINDS